MAVNERIEELFGELAISRGLVTASQLERCRFLRQRMQEQGTERRMGEVMIEAGLISKAQGLDLLKAAHEKLGDTKRIGNFELLDKLGEGAMGAVYKARQLSMDRIVALKLLPRALSSEPAARDRFLREAKIIAKFNHPHIIRGLEVGEANGYHFMAMEFVDGRTLADFLEKNPALLEEDAAAIGIQVADALSQAHEAGIIHRDVKPGNIMQDSSGMIKLADLGLAVEVGEVGAVPTRTQAGGTPYYMAPEQVEEGREIDARSDLYALGATLFHLVTGKTPFVGEDIRAVASRRLWEDAPFAHEVAGQVSLGMSAIIAKAMRRQPEGRYKDALEMKADLERLRVGEKPLALAEFPALVRKFSAEEWLTANIAWLKHHRPQRPEWLTLPHAAVALLLLALGLGGAWLGKNYKRMRGPQPPPGIDKDWTPPLAASAQLGKGAAVHVAWMALRSQLPKKVDDEARAQSLRDFIQEYPGTASARRAELLLSTMSAASSASHDGK